MKAVTMFTMILESSSCSDQLQCNIQRHLFSQIVKKYIQKLGRYIVLYKLNRRKVAMQRQLIVQAPQRDDNQVRTRDRSLSFADDNQIDGHHLAFAHYINAGNNETEAQNNQIYVVNGQYSEQIQLNQSYNIENNQFSYDQQNDTPPMPMYMNDISGYLQNGNESMQLQHKAHQQQEQYWSKYFRKDEDSDDSLSDEEDNKISEKKVEEIFGKEEEQKMEENIITFKKILNEEEFNGNMVESRLKKLFQLILPSPFHNSPRNMMQFGRMLRKQSFQKLNRNYRTIIKKPTQDGFKQMGQRQIKVTFNNEVSLKFFRREEQVWTLQGASQIVEQINQIEKRSRITPSMLMQQWQQYQRQPLHSKFTISNTVQQWILPSRSALIWDGMNKHNNRFYIEQGRVSGQSQLEYSNSFRTVDLKIIPIHNNHQVFADVNDSV